MILKLTDQASPALERVADAADDAAEGAENAGGQFKITGATLAKFGASALAAGAAVGVLIKALADSKNELTAASIQTGLTANTLAGLRLAAEGSGLALDALTGGLVDLPKRMDEANRETGEALIAFKRLGIEVANADGSLRSVDSVLSESVEKLSGVANAAERSALSTILFGGAGANLMQALGGNELEEFVDQAERFGVTVGPEAAKAAGDFQRELAQTSMVAEKSAEVFLSAFGTGPGGASSVLKAFGALMLGLSTVFDGFMDSMRQFFGGFTGFVGDVLGQVLELGSVLKAVMGGDFSKAADLAETSLKRIAQAAEDNAKQTGGAFVDLMLGRHLIKGFDAAMGAFNLPTAGTGGGVQRQVTQLTAAEEPGAGEDLAKQREADRKAREKEAKEQQKAFDQMRKDMETTAREMEGLVRVFEELPAKIAEGFAGALSDPGSALASSLGPSGAILTTLSDLGAKNPKEIAKQFRSFFKNIVRALVKVIPELLTTLPEILAQNIPVLIVGIIKALPRIVEAFVIKMPIAFAKGLAQWFVSALKKIKEAFSLSPGRVFEGGEAGKKARGGLLKGAATGAAIGSVVPGVGTAAGAIAGALVGLFGSKQTGGFVQSTGFQYLHAGERVVPPTGASTSSMMQAAGNIGGGQTINIHTNVVDPNSIRQLGILLNREFGNKGRTQGLSIFNNANPLAGAV